MLLIHTPKLTNRLGYTLGVIFGHLLHIDYSITTDEDLFLSSDDAKLNYGHRRLGDGLFIKSHGLLQETSIEDQEPHAECRNGQWTLYPIYGRDIDFDFDPLAATFFMVSRYEEYLPHRTDQHGRFSATESIAYREGFLDEPVVEQWAQMIAAALHERYPNLPIRQPSYHFVQTVDIDAAWSYLHKGLLRTSVGMLRDLIVRRDPSEVVRRIRVLLHRDNDPFDTFDYIITHHRTMPKADLIFFVLLADYGEFDKPASYLNRHFRELVQHIGDYGRMGIHPGYRTIDHPSLIDKERQRLSDILHRPVKRSRYHFLRLRLPDAYRILLHAGIHNDFSMGYPDAIGFRAGISTPYPFYDLERDLQTELTIHPFCVMDTTLQKYLKISPEEGIASYRSLIDKIRAVGGTYCCIVHNQNLSDIAEWKGWRQCYEQMLSYANQ